MRLRVDGKVAAVVRQYLYHKGTKNTEPQKPKAIEPQRRGERRGNTEKTKRQDKAENTKREWGRSHSFLFACFTGNNRQKRIVLGRFVKARFELVNRIQTLQPLVTSYQSSAQYKFTPLSSRLKGINGRAVSHPYVNQEPAFVGTADRRRVIATTNRMVSNFCLTPLQKMHRYLATPACT